MQQAMLHIAGGALMLLSQIALTREVSAQFWDRMSNPKVQVALRHPPGLGLNVAKIAFGPARGDNSDQFVDALVQDFVQAGIEVIDRQHVQELLAEHEFTLSGYVDQKSAAALGKILGPAALIFINVQRATTEKKQLYEDLQDRQGVRHRRYLSRTQAFFKASVQTVDLTTGRIFQAVTLDFSPKEEHESIDRCCAEFPSEYTVLDNAINLAVIDVHRLFAPWSENREMYFFDDKTCGLKNAHAMLKAGDVEGVFAESKRSVEECQVSPKVKPKVVAHAQYNLGMAHVLKGDYDEALRLFSESQRTDASGITVETMAETRRMKEVAEARRRVEVRAALGAEGPGANVGAAATTRTASYVSKGAAASQAPGPSNEGGIEERLRRLDELYRKKLITKVEYDRKRAELLKQL